MPETRLVDLASVELLMGRPEMLDQVLPKPAKLVATAATSSIQVQQKFSAQLDIQAQAAVTRRSSVSYSYDGDGRAATVWTRHFFSCWAVDYVWYGYGVWRHRHSKSSCLVSTVRDEGSFSFAAAALWSLASSQNTRPSFSYLWTLSFLSVQCCPSSKDMASSLYSNSVYGRGSLSEIEEASCCFYFCFICCIWPAIAFFSSCRNHQPTTLKSTRPGQAK